MAEAQATAKCCGRCGTAIAAGEPVAVRWVDYTCRDKNFFATYAIVATCIACGGHKSDTFEPCAGCRRPTANREFCSEACRVRAWTWERSDARDEARAARRLHCTRCGRPFTPARRGDARYCSAACRQAAYRVRRAS